MKLKSIVYFLFCLCFSTGNFAQSFGGATTGAVSSCGTSNSGFISLSGASGAILNWQSSIDGGNTWTDIANILSTQSYFSIPQTTCYRAIVQSGAFPPDTSTVSCVTVYDPTVAGTLSAGITSCGTSGAGTITLSGNTGAPLNWQSSIDGGATWTSIANTTTTLNYAAVTQTTIYEAVVQNSSFCLIDTSTQSTITILPPSIAGTLTLGGNDTVCYLVNSSLINSNGNTGNVIGWLSSVSGGTFWVPLANTTTTLNSSGIIQPTTYAAIVQNGTCTADTTLPITINVFPPPPAVNAGLDTIIQLGQSVTLNGVGTGTPLWSPAAGLNNALIYSPTATPTSTTNYILFVADINSCLNSDTVQITVVQPNFSGFISNYFSPNGDGVNDTWFIQDITFFPKNEVTVFNIYGNEVYTKTAYTNDWKGTYNGADLPDGTYYYVVKFTDTNKIIKGTIDIIRKK
jgi:gliding motility-associated-like protein